MTEKSKSFNWWSLILGILYIVIGVLTFNKPAESIVAMVYVYGLLAIFRGIGLIILRNRIEDYTRFAPNGLLVLGIIDIILGVLLLFNVEIGIITIPILFALWFLTDSISMVASSGPIKLFSPWRYWLTIIIGVIGIIIGVYLLFNPAVALAIVPTLIGTYFVIMGIVHIVYAF